MAARTHRHEMVREHLLHLIGGLRAHDRLPTERELAAELDVSRLTVRRALDQLAAEHIIHRVQGAGTFVADPVIHLTEDLKSFSEQMRARGLAPSSRVLETSERACTAQQSWKLNRSPGEPLLRILRVRRGGDMAMCLEEVFVVKELAPGLLECDLTASLYATLAEQYGIEVAFATQSMTATVLSAREAGLLEVAPLSAAMRIQRVSFTAGGESVELATSLYRGDQYTFEQQLSRATLVRTYR